MSSLADLLGFGQTQNTNEVSSFTSFMTQIVQSNLQSCLQQVDQSQNISITCTVEAATAIAFINSAPCLACSQALTIQSTGTCSQFCSACNVSGTSQTAVYQLTLQCQTSSSQAATISNNINDNIAQAITDTTSVLGQLISLIPNFNTLFAGKKTTINAVDIQNQIQNLVSVSNIQTLINNITSSQNVTISSSGGGSISGTTQSLLFYSASSLIATNLQNIGVTNAQTLTVSQAQTTTTGTTDLTTIIIIVVGAVVGLLLIYLLYRWFSSSKKKKANNNDNNPNPNENYNNQPPQYPPQQQQQPTYYPNYSMQPGHPIYHSYYQPQPPQMAEPVPRSIAHPTIYSQPHPPPPQVAEPVTRSTVTRQTIPQPAHPPPEVAEPVTRSTVTGQTTPQPPPPIGKPTGTTRQQTGQTAQLKRLYPSVVYDEPVGPGQHTA